MESPIANATLMSNSGADSFEWTVYDYNEDFVAIDLKIVARSLVRDREIETELDDFVYLTVPHIVCSRLAFADFVSRLGHWAMLPLEQLARSDVRFVSELRSSPHLFQESFRVELLSPDIARSSGDHRRVQVTWVESMSTISFGMTIDVSTAATFVSKMKTIGQPGATDNLDGA